MKTIGTKKLNLNLQTLVTLTSDALDGARGGVKQGIVSTDTPSVCFACRPRPEPRPGPGTFSPSLVGNCPPTIKG